MIINHFICIPFAGMGRQSMGLRPLNGAAHSRASGGGSSTGTGGSPAGWGGDSRDRGDSPSGSGGSPYISGGNSGAGDVRENAARMLDQYGNGIMRLAYSYLHNMSDAEDILQDTLIQYIKHQPYFATPSKEKAWLFTVAANLSKNKIKYNQLRETDELQDNLIQEEREDLSLVWAAVKDLPPKYREAIHLFYYEGYSVKEIARILHRNESTVRSDLRRGRERLRTILEEAYDFE